MEGKKTLANLIIAILIFIAPKLAHGGNKNIKGKIKEDGSTVEGQWQQRGHLLPLKLKRPNETQIEAKGQSGSEIAETREKQDQMGSFPKFEFDVWGSPPSSKVYELTRDKLVQKILYSIKESSFEPDEIAAIVKDPKSLVLEKLKELERYDLVKREKEKWISNIPLFVEQEIRQAEKIGLKYALKEAKILQKEIPKLKDIYSKTTVSRYFSWDEVSLIIVGALLSDFCVVDRIPFMPGNQCEDLQPRLGTKGIRKWQYDGFQKLDKRFPSRKWKFYQNVTPKPSGGLSRFGYYRNPNERRKTPPSRPEDWAEYKQGRILFALAEGPLDFQRLQDQTSLKNETLLQALEEMTGYNPPAVLFENGKYRSTIPILSDSDLLLLLPECDRIAQVIFDEVVLPHLEERKTKAKEFGYRWALPADTYVRDKALQILEEQGLLTPVSPPPVDWNFGVWGWKGFLAMHDQVSQNLKPDPFLKTTISTLPTFWYLVAQGNFDLHGKTFMPFGQIAKREWRQERRNK